MYAGKLVFAQVMDYLPMHILRRCTERYDGNRYVKHFTCRDQFLGMAFAQLTSRESLRDTVTCLNAHESKLYHMGFRNPVSRSTLSDANRIRDWRIHADFAQALIKIARDLYVGDGFSVELDNTVYVLDSTTIDLCLSVFPWAHFRRAKGAVKVHTLLDLKGNIPTVIRVTSGNSHDVNMLDNLLPEVGAIYIMDRAYVDYRRLYRFHQASSFFVIRAKSNLRCHHHSSETVDESSGLRGDQIITLSDRDTLIKYPDRLRKVDFYDDKNDKTLTFLTNNFILPPLIIARLYKARWQVELFFKWIKQHLRIKKFYGTTENAVKTQIWIAVSVYVLVAIIKKRLDCKLSPYTILQILSVTLFERTPLIQMLRDSANRVHPDEDNKQLNLFEF